MHEISTWWRLLKSSSTISFNLPLIYLHEKEFSFSLSPSLRTSISILFYFHARFYKCEVNRKVISKETSEESNVECLLVNIFPLFWVLEATNNDWTLLCNAVNSISTIFYFLMWLQFQNRFAKEFDCDLWERERHVEIDGWWPYAKLFHLVYSIFPMREYQNWIFSWRVYWKSFLVKNFNLEFFWKVWSKDVELLRKYYWEFCKGWELF